MSILITGGTGFIGLNLAEALLGRDEHVVIAAIDEIPAAARRAFLGLPGQLTEARADVRDVEHLIDIMRRHQVDRMFPLAAITSGPDREAEMPERILEVNLLGFVKQLRAARDAGVKRIVAPASGAVYGESYFDRPVVDEETPCFPTDLYGTSKFAVERAGLRLGGLWSLDLVVARIGGTFGPWEHDTSLRDLITPYWRIADHAVSGRKAVLPASIPPCSWTYSRDVASGLLHLLDAAEPAHRVFNVSSGADWGPMLLRWPERLARTFPGFVWRQASDAAEVNVPLPDTRPRARMDISRMLEVGWAPKFTPDTAYDHYAEWLSARPDALAA